MILRDRALIFVHVPKTGGTSIEDALFPPEDQRRADEHLWGYPNPHQTGGLQHLKALQIRDVVGRYQFERCFRFAFVRNPWDKAVSMYSYHRTRLDLQRKLGILDRNPIRKALGMRRMAPFRTYLEAVRDGPAHVQWEAQHRFLDDENGDCLVQFLGRFERLAEDFDALCRRIGSPGITLPHRMQSRHRPYVEHYDEATKQIVAELYAEDIERFGYRFGT